MKFVEFKKVSIENFLSIGRDPVVIEFEQGMNIITGVNVDMMDRRNGCGKSAVAESLYFAIFGSTLREISKKDLIVNNVTNGTCIVELCFNIHQNGVVKHYKVTRSLNPGKCFLYEDDADITRDSISNTTQYLCELIDASPSIFQNCIIMTLNQTVPFMAQKEVEKRKFIESIFSLQVFSKMLTCVRDEYSELKKQYEMELFRCNEVQSSISNLEKQQQGILIDRQQKLQSLLDRKNNSDAKKQTLQEKLNSFVSVDVAALQANITTLEQHREKNQTTIDRLVKKIAVADTQVVNLESKLKQIGTDQNKCPVCLKSVDQHDKELIAAEKAEIKKQIEELKTGAKADKEALKKQKDNREQSKEFINKLSAKINQQNIADKEKQGIQKEIDNLDQWGATVDEDIKHFDNNRTNLDEPIEEGKVKHASIVVRTKNILASVNMLDTAKTIVSDEGVKAYITRKILQALNAKIQFYLKKIGFNCVCKFNEYFEEEILNAKGRICSYFNFSGAERRSIDLACLFAFTDIRRTQGNVAYNIVFYDELLDSSLDDTGVKLVCNIITERAKQHNECAYIITHRKDSIKDAKTIFLQKENGITKRVD